MKKIISILCAVTFLFSLFSLTTFAKESAITFSEDYQTLFADGHSYSRFDPSMLEVEFSHSETNVVLSETQQEKVEEVNIDSSEDRIVITATISFDDGSRLEVTFLRDDYREEYERLLKSRDLKYSINFQWPENNVVAASEKQLFGKVVVLDDKALEGSDAFDVWASDGEGSLTILRGALLVYEEGYYYVDYVESNVKDGRSYQIHQYEDLIIHKVTDESLLSKLMKAQEAYWDDGLGFFDDDKFTETVSIIFLSFVFALIPLVILAVALIFAIRSKGIYKKMHRITYILCGAELVIFAVIATIMLIAK